MKGSCVECSESLKFDYDGGGFSPHYSIDRLSANEGLLLFSSEDNIGRIFANEGNNYKVISSSVVVGAIANGGKLSIKPFLFSEFLNYFLEVSTVTDLQENIADLMAASLFPNPFSSGINIRFETPAAGSVRVDIFDINGRLVKELVHRHFEPGNHPLWWDGTDNNGSRLSPGQYFCRIQAGNIIETHKVIVVR